MGVNGDLTVHYCIPKAIFYLLKGDYQFLNSNPVCGELYLHINPDPVNQASSTFNP